MTVGDALDLAMALHRAPVQRFAIRDRPLPEDIDVVIRLASAPKPLLERAASRLAEPQDKVLEAVRFYLQQVLFERDADAYRILGLERDAPFARIREHHYWLQRWLHPDRNSAEWDSLFASRVNWAWAQLRTASSRHAYDATLRDSAKHKPDSAPEPVRPPVARWIPAPLALPASRWPKRIALGLLLVSCLVLVFAVRYQNARVAPEPVVIDSTAGAGPVESTALAVHGAEPAMVSRQHGGASPQPLPAAADKAPAPRGGSALRPDHGAGVAALASRQPPAAAPNRVTVPVVGVPGLHRAGNTGDRIAPAHAEAAAITAPARDRVPEITPARPILVAPSSLAVTQIVPQSVAAVAPTLAHRTTRQSNGAATRVVAVALPTRIAPALSFQPDIPPPRTSKLYPVASVSRPIQPVDSVQSGAVMVKRFDLARSRVREIVASFRATGADQVAARSGDSSRDSVPSADSARPRDGFAGTRLFTLEGARWRLSNDALTMHARYHAKRTDGAVKSGRFAVDMVWRGGAWQVLRVNLAPAP